MLTSDTMQLIRRVDDAKSRLDVMRPLPPHTVASLRDKLALEWTYHSNGIEGNTLTLRETKVVLEGITVGGKSLREHLEARNHGEAISYIEELVARQEPLSEWQIRNVHAFILKGVDDRNAGQYRQENVAIAGASKTPPPFFQLPQLLSELVAWHTAAHGLNPIVRAAELHARLVGIHPFVDGNGRTARLVMNLELMKAGYPPAILRIEERLGYYDALDLACTETNYNPIIQMTANAVLRSLDSYFELL